MVGFHTVASQPFTTFLLSVKYAPSNPELAPPPITTEPAGHWILAPFELPFGGTEAVPLSVVIVPSFEARTAPAASVGFG